MRPPPGVYATEARVGRSWRPALTSIGRQLTFPRPPRRAVVEVYVPGLRRDLCGRDVEVRFIRKIRDQIRFDSADDLVAQMHRDLAALKGEGRWAKKRPSRKRGRRSS